jgi:hypothetical protein
LDAVENQVCIEGPEKDGIVGNVLSLVADSWISRDSLKGIEEFPNPALGSVNVVVSDVFPNLVQVQLRAGA